jgi:voltage-gated potassium channel
LWGLKLAPGDNVPARVVETHWRWPTVLVLAATTPAFYLELLRATPPLGAQLLYLLAALVTGAALLHTGLRSGRLAEHLQGNPVDLLLCAGLVAAAVLPPSSNTAWALAVRLVVAFLTLLRMVWSLQHLFTRGSIVYMIAVAGALLLLCGAGYWWLEPTTPTLLDGLWLAFATAATVGYGDVVPTTTASKIFSIFVVLLGFGVLSMVTAAVATRWVETEERIIEREILRDMHKQMDALHADIDALRRELVATREQQAWQRRDVPPPD